MLRWWRRRGSSADIRTASAFSIIYENTVSGLLSAHPVYIIPMRVCVYSVLTYRTLVDLVFIFVPKTYLAFLTRSGTTRGFVMVPMKSNNTLCPPPRAPPVIIIPTNIIIYYTGYHLSYFVVFFFFL